MTVELNEQPRVYSAKKALDLTAEGFSWDKTGLKEYRAGEEMRDDAEVYGVSGTEKERLEKAVWLPRLYRLKHLHTLKTDDENFAQITRCTTLTRLHLERPQVSSFAGLEKLVNLTHLFLRSAPRVPDLKMLPRLTRLKALYIVGSYQQIGHLRDVGKIPNLQSLGIMSSDFKTLRFPSIGELQPLVNLRILSLGGLRFADKTLKPLAELKQLEYLTLHEPDLKQYSRAEFQYLHENLPNLKNDLIRYAATVPEFQKKWKIKA